MSEFHEGVDGQDLDPRAVELDVSLNAQDPDFGTVLNTLKICFGERVAVTDNVVSRLNELGKTKFSTEQLDQLRNTAQQIAEEILDSYDTNVLPTEMDFPSDVCDVIDLMRISRDARNNINLRKS